MGVRSPISAVKQKDIPYDSQLNVNGYPFECKVTYGNPR